MLIRLINTQLTELPCNPYKTEQPSSKGMVDFFVDNPSCITSQKIHYYVSLHCNWL